MSEIEEKINIKGASYALYCLKNELPFWILYKDEEGNTYEKYVRFGYPYKSKKGYFFLFDPDTEEIIFVNPYNILYCYPDKKYLNEIFN